METKSKQFFFANSEKTSRKVSQDWGHSFDPNLKYTEYCDTQRRFHCKNELKLSYG